jgi:hypothetical protein
VETDRVVLEVDARARGLRRQGRILRSRGPLLTVEWEDGHQDELRLGHREGMRYMAPPAGGLTHRFLVDPRFVTTLLDTSPEQVFALALRDLEKPATSRQLVERLKQDFPGSDISEYWKRARQAIEADPDVTVTGQARQRRYQWTGSATTDPVQIVIGDPQAQDPPAAPSPTSADPPLPPTDSPEAPATSAGRVDLVQVLTDMSRGSEVTLPDAELAATLQEATPALRLVFSSLAYRGRPSDLDAENIKYSLRRPLASGVALGYLPEKTLAEAGPGLERSGALIAAVPRNSKAADSIDVVALLGPEGAAMLLSAAQAEFRAIPKESPNADSLSRAFNQLVRRSLSAPSANQLRPPALLRATALMPADDETHADWVAGLVEASLAHGGREYWQTVSSGDRADVARRVGSAPLRAASGRARVLLWLWRNDRPSLDDPSWWRDVAVDELIDVASTSLAAALEHPQIADHVVRPLVRSALADVSTRRRLMTMLGSPSAIARVMNPQDVERALQRVLRADEVARAWLAEIGKESNLQTMERQVIELTERAHSLESAVDAARTAAKSQEERSLRAEERLAQAAAERHELRDTQARQIRMDTVRGLAEVAAYVHGAVGVQTPERIRQRIASKVEREGLIQVGEIGQQVAYQPRLHEIVGPDTSPGDPVTVRGVGYILSGVGAEDVVLTRAVVEPTE